jgi:hypothetical protein
MDMDLSEDEEEHLKNYRVIPISHNEIIQNCGFSDENMIPPSSGLNKSVIEYEPEPTDENHSRERSEKQTISNRIETNRRGSGWLYQIHRLQKFTESPDERKSLGSPTMAGVVKRLVTQEGKLLDEKQYMTYEIICCTFLLELLRDAQDDTTSLYNNMQTALKKT